MMPRNPGRSGTPPQTAGYEEIFGGYGRDFLNVCPEPGAGALQKVKAAAFSAPSAADHSTPVSRAPSTPRSGSKGVSPRGMELKKLRKEVALLGDRNKALEFYRQQQELQEGHQVSEAEKKAGAIAALNRQLQVAKETLDKLMSMTDAEALDNVTAAAGEVPAANLFNQVWGLGFSASPP